MESNEFPYNWTGKTIIIADNLEVSHLLTSLILEETNCTQIWIRNGLELINFCKENYCVNLILMESQLPLFSGIEATKAIKLIKPDLPIIAFTPFYDKDIFIKAGCVAFLRKPVDDDTLYSTIHDFL